jgi:hypothetical protein
MISVEEYREFLYRHEYSRHWVWPKLRLGQNFCLTFLIDTDSKLWYANDPDAQIIIWQRYISL